MKKIKNYKSAIILIGAIIIGGLVGLVFGEKASILSSFGDLFLNLLLISVVPLVFLTITSSIYEMKQPKRIGKVFVSIFIVFILTSLVSTLIGIGGTYSFKLIDTKKGEIIKESLGASEEVISEKVNYMDKIVQTISVNDFSKLLSRDNMIALILVSVLVGVAMNMSKEKAKPFYQFISSATAILNNFIKIISYYAPIGLGCYFAAMVGTFGSFIAIGYLKTFVIYLIIFLILYFIIYSFYAYISAGKMGLKCFWKNILPATLTALATCSSAASVPINIECTKNMGVSSEISNTTISLGTQFHKDGSVISSVFKIMFLVYLFNSDITVLKVMEVALIATLLISAVPIGGGTIAEMLIITMLGFPVAALPILTIIATITDAPATILNVVGDSASSMLVSRIVYGKNWILNKEQHELD